MLNTAQYRFSERLPMLEQPEHPDDATEHITAIGQFVVNLASRAQKCYRYIFIFYVRDDDDDDDECRAVAILAQETSVNFSLVRNISNPLAF